VLRGLRHAQELLKPFLQACEVKNAKLVTVALSSFQKLVANGGVSNDGRKDIIQALCMVRGPGVRPEHVRTTC
jgi:hypothetical protein